MAVITKAQVDFMLEESLKIRMENERLMQENERLRTLVALRPSPAQQAIDDAFDRGYDAGHKAARALMKG